MKNRLPGINLKFHPRPILLGAAFFLTIPFFVGCSGGDALLSSHPANGPTGASIVNGNFYFLPKGRITLTGKFKTAATATNVEATKKAMDAAEKAKKIADEKLVDRKAIATSSKDKEGENDAKKAVDAAEKAAKDAAAALLAAKKKHSSAVKEAGFASDFVVSMAAHNDPDPNYRYLLSHTFDGFYSDDVTLSVGDNGLLTSVTTSTTDATPEIIQDVVETAIYAAKLSGGVPGGADLTEDTKTITYEPFQVDFDPLNEQDYQRAKHILDDCGVILKVCAKTQPNTFAKNDCFSTPNDIDMATFEGVVFRPGTAVEISLQVKGTKVTETNVVIVPDPSTIYAFDMSRASLVTKDTALTFSNGMLTKTKVKQPSQVAGFFSIPAKALKSVVDAQ